MIRIVKVGGSLLDLVDLPQRLRAWLSRQAAAHSVLLVGGGALVDEVRRQDAAGTMDEAAAHWLCIDLMKQTAAALHARLPDMRLTDDAEALTEGDAAPRATIFDCGSWLRKFEPGIPGVRLPASWATSSDSIAGRIAIALAADELVLLKSSLPPAGVANDATSLAAAAYIDAMFPQLAGELPPTRLVDLRDDAFPEVRLAKFSDFAPA